MVTTMRGQTLERKGQLHTLRIIQLTTLNKISNAGDLHLSIF